MDSFKKILLYAGGAAGVAAVLYYLLREEEAEAKANAPDSAADGAGKGKKLKAEDVSKEQVQQILREIVESQEKMRAHMKTLTLKLLEKAVPFEQTYQHIREVQPEDPLERYGLTMMDFDHLLNKHQNDPEVREGIGKIMGVPESGRPGAVSKGVPAKQIIDVHSFMLEELDRLVKYFSTIKNKETYDMKTVTLAAQAVVGAKVEEKYGLTSEDIESAVIEHHTTLATDQEFASVNMRMQQTMAQLMGAQGA